MAPPAPVMLFQKQAPPRGKGSFGTTPYLPAAREPLASRRLRSAQTETLLEPAAPADQQWSRHRGERLPTADRLQMTNTFPPTQSIPPTASPYRRPAETQGNVLQKKYDSVQNQPGWREATAASVRSTRANHGPLHASVVPKLQLSKSHMAPVAKSHSFDPMHECRPLTERAQVGLLADDRPMSKRLEHRLRSKFNKVDGCSGLTVSPNRADKGSGRWNRLIYTWEETDRARAGKSIPSHSASVLKTVHATREFRSDSMFSPTRRPDDIFANATRCRAAHVIQGGVALQDTTTSDYGKFFGSVEVQRPCTAGIRMNPWNYHWQMGPSQAQSAWT